ncbi:MAG: AAA family ATPase [Albidovulum sp.]|nr:AAA family ATPase [Albidovulum sp.]
MIFIRRLELNGLLSFPRDMEPLDLRPLNVLIGPNGSGKSNFIEALELLRATPTDFAAAIRDGGGAVEWLWKGVARKELAKIDLETGDANSGLQTPTSRPMRYRLEFTSANNRVEVLDEAIEEIEPVRGHADPYFYYRFQQGRPVINLKQDDYNQYGFENGRATRHLRRDDLLPDQSVLAQRKDPELYPEVTWIGRHFERIQTFREWSFGRYASLRRPQPADLPENRLLPDSRNLAMLLNQVEHRDPTHFNDLLKKFFPRFERMSTRISGGTVQFYLHERDFRSAIPPTRLSDGTIRFIAILAILLAPEPPPLVCIEEPELGMHPDAVALIGELLVEASRRMQVIVTTHSDALVSVLSSDPEAVIACERPGMGTTLRRLDAGKLSHWLNDYGLGDLWRMGELGANP